MIRFLTVFNFLGVVALVVLCSIQWKANENLQNIERDQSKKITDQGQTIKGDAADLDDFRSRLSLSETELKATEQKLRTATTQRDQLIASVAERDAALKNANTQIQSLAIERNDSIARFNDLANKYNSLVKDRQ